MTVLLAIETSQREGGVALRDASGAVHVRAFRGEARRDDALMPAIDAVVREAGLAPRAIDAVGVSIGPGGFTGLRIGISTAKMLAEVLGARVAAVPGALVAAGTAARSRPLEGDVLVVLAVKRGSFWATRTHWDGREWQLRETPCLARAETLSLEGIRYVVADRHLPDVVRARCGGDGGPEILPLRLEPEACLAVADRMLVRGEVTEPLALAPLYAREPEAVTLWESRRRRQ